jgi:hypothetical protein
MAKNPKDTFLQQIGIPQVRAALEIKRGNPAAAAQASRGIRTRRSWNPVVSRYGVSCHEIRDRSGSPV